MRLEEALSFRLANGAMLGQLPEEDWRREVERATDELNQMYEAGRISAAGTNRSELQARLDYTRDLLDALRAIIDRPLVQSGSN